METLVERIQQIRERIEHACTRSGRAAQSVRLMAVSKTHPARAICEAYAGGIRLFGENRVQEFASKAEGLADLDAEFHLIGHLQSNKAGKAAELFDAVQSVDSLKLARKLDAEATRVGKRLPVLVEINVGAEEAKSGFAPDSAELDQLWGAASQLRSLQIRGLMAIPPHTEDPEGARPYFRQLREIRDRLVTRKIPGVGLDDLSMGMSHDFEIAIEEGSTLVRIGTAIFGERGQR